MAQPEARMLTDEQYAAISGRLTAYVAGQMEPPRHWLEWPKVRDLARRYRIRQADVLAMIEDSEELDLLVAFRSGGGVGELDDKGDYRVEYYGEPHTPETTETETETDE